MADKTITLEIFRYDPDTKATEPNYQSYQVPYHEDHVVLDAINYVKDNLDSTLAYRWSCRMGVCGSCGMMINGYPMLSCAAFLRDYYPNPIKIEPLVNFPVERDLITGMDDFMEKLHSVKPWLIRQHEKPLEDGEYLQTPGQVARYKQFTMCINCTLCYAACPVYGRVDDFIGPAALALAQRYNLDSRDQAGAERRDIVYSAEGIWECTFVGECSTVCPKHVDPAGAIQQAKVDGAIDYMKKLLMPWSGKA